MKKVIFMDMDGPLCDFDNAIGHSVGHPQRGIFQTDKKIVAPMYEKGFFYNLPITEGAIWGINKLKKLKNFEIFIASNATTDQVLYSPSEKYEWLKKHFPWLVHRVMLTCDKRLLKGHYLVDDQKDRWAKVFDGKFIWFDTRSPVRSWTEVVRYFQKLD